MIAYLLFEAADIAYTLGKFGYNSARATYYWYYGLEYPETKQIQNKEQMIEQLNKRIETLEQLQHNNTTTDDEPSNHRLRVDECGSRGGHVPHWGGPVSHPVPPPAAQRHSPPLPPGRLLHGRPSPAVATPSA